MNRQKSNERVNLNFTLFKDMSILHRKAGDILRTKELKPTSDLTENERHKLVHKHDVHQIQLKITIPEIKKKPEPPHACACVNSGCQSWASISCCCSLSLSGDLNPRPTNYESVALPTELKRRKSRDEKTRTSDPHVPNVVR